MVANKNEITTTTIGYGCRTAKLCVGMLIKLWCLVLDVLAGMKICFPYLAAMSAQGPAHNYEGG